MWSISQIAGGIGVSAIAALGLFAADARIEDKVEDFGSSEVVVPLAGMDSVLLDRIIAIEEYNQEQEKTQRAQLDSQLRTECMNFKHQNLSAEDRYRVCEQESKDRRAWWSWSDCMKAGRTDCGVEPPRPQGIG